MRISGLIFILSLCFPLPLLAWDFTPSSFVAFNSSTLCASFKNSPVLLTLSMQSSTTTKIELSTQVSTFSLSSNSTARSVTVAGYTDNAGQMTGFLTANNPVTLTVTACRQQPAQQSSFNYMPFVLALGGIVSAGILGYAIISAL